MLRLDSHGINELRGLDNTLRAASSHEVVVQMLIDNGGDINAPGVGVGVGNALQVAYMMAIR
jgi:hypothetical protein